MGSTGRKSQAWRESVIVRCADGSMYSVKFDEPEVPATAVAGTVNLMRQTPSAANPPSLDDSSCVPRHGIVVVMTPAA